MKKLLKSLNMWAESVRIAKLLASRPPRNAQITTCIAWNIAILPTTSARKKMKHRTVATSNLVLALELLALAIGALYWQHSEYDTINDGWPTQWLSRVSDVVGCHVDM